jgi:phosphopantothenoylcysteine synthetase/decarboxylase
MLGIIYPESCSFYEAATEAFKAHLAANGFGPGQLEIFVQKPAADQMSWTNAVRKFGAVDADLIVVWGDSLLQTACREKLKTKSCDLVVANAVGAPGAGFGSDRNRVSLVGPAAVEEVEGTKGAVADLILDRIVPLLDARRPRP